MIAFYEIPQRKRAHIVLGGERGFLSAYPHDVVAVVNGQPITKTDILNSKRARQARRLEIIRRPTEPVIRPCWVWVFNNGPIIPYGGWWLYIKTAKYAFCIDDRRMFSFDGFEKIKLRVMSLFPCGCLPHLAFWGLWCRSFAERYHRPIKHRPTDNGMALARAKLAGGQLEDVFL